MPTDPPPGFGGLLLGAVVAQHIPGVDPDLHPDVRRLILEVERGQRVVQPRLRHRFQVDRHGLAVSRHRLVGNGDDLEFDFNTTGSDLAKLLDVMVAYDPEDPLTAAGVGKTDGSYTRFLDANGLKGARIGILRESVGQNSDPASDDFKKVDAAFAKAVDATLTRLGELLREPAKIRELVLGTG